MPPEPSVLVISTSYPLRAASTSGVFVRRLVDALADRFAMSVLCPADALPASAHAAARVRILPFRYGPRRWQLLAQSPGGVLPSIRATPALLMLLPVFVTSLAWATLRHARHADLVHANWAICGAIAGALRFVHRRPIVVTLRGDDVTAAERSTLHRILLKTAVARADAVVCVAESMAANLRERMPAAARKISVALNGVGDEFAGDAVTGDQPADPSPIRVICIGSLIPRKGIDVLIRAIAQLQRPDVRLQIVGEGPQRAQLLALAHDLGIEAQLDFVGQQPPDAIPALLASSAVFVLASHSEGRPNVLLEAMAAGVAIVATRIDGVSETVIDGEHAWLVEAGNAKALSAALADAIDRPLERRRRGAAARAEVHARGWTWSATADVYAQLFTRLLASR